MDSSALYAPSVLARFWAKVDKTGVCWTWTARTTYGYGRFLIEGRDLPAHRVAYAILVGPIPEGLQLDHLCRNRACVNPDHLEPVTQRVNILRGASPAATKAVQTHCKNGHPFDAENTKIRKNGTRFCRRCDADSHIRRRAARAAEQKRTS